MQDQAHDLGAGWADLIGSIQSRGTWNATDQAKAYSRASKYAAK
jgi:hypothetical protein